MGFLPEGQKIPATAGKYLKLTDKEVRFRVLSLEPLTGYMGWRQDGDKRMPIRKPMGAEWHDEEVEGNETRYFWALAVYGYDAKRVQVLELTQGSVIGAIDDLSKDEDYGHPNNYDIVVRGNGKAKLERRYTVTPKPPKPVAEEVALAWTKLSDRFDLTRLYAGGDPFGDDPAAKSSEVKSLYEEGDPGIQDDDIPF